MRPIARMTLAALLGWAGSIAPAFSQDFTYRNERFGTSATFPADIFSTALEAPAEGDGLGWVSPDGANIFVYGRENAGGETPRSVIAGRAGVDDVTYNRSGNRWAVVSGYRDGEIFYERYIFRGDLIHSVSIRYPQTERATYDRLVGPITMSLRGPGEAF